MFDIVMSYANQTQEVGAGVYVVSFIFAVINLVALAKIFIKAGQPGWAVIIPYYNLVCLFRIAYGKGIKWLLLFVPILNIIAGIMVYVRLGQRFGKGTGFILGLLFLSPIFLIILAFDDSYYMGPDESAFL